MVPAPRTLLTTLGVGGLAFIAVLSSGFFGSAMATTSPLHGSTVVERGPLRRTSGL
jgi:hypothetical protein